MPTEPVSTSQPFATVEELQDATRGRIKSTDPYALDALRAASKEIRNIAGWHIAPVVIEEVTVDSRGDRLLLLPTMKLLEPLAVTLKGSVTSLTVDTDYEWSDNGVLERNGYWPLRRRGVVALIRHGWEPEDIPEVKNLCLTLAARSIVASRAMGVVQEGVGTNQMKLSTVNGGLIAVEVMPHELTKLRPYIIPGRA